MEYRARVLADQLYGNDADHGDQREEQRVLDESNAAVIRLQRVCDRPKAATQRHEKSRHSKKYRHDGRRVQANFCAKP
jgi:hypothetical protein